MTQLNAKKILNHIAERYTDAQTMDWVASVEGLEFPGTNTAEDATVTVKLKDGQSYKLTVTINT